MLAICGWKLLGADHPPGPVTLPEGEPFLCRLPTKSGETRVAEVKPAVPNETMARDDDDDVDVVP